MTTRPEIGRDPRLSLVYSEAIWSREGLTPHAKLILLALATRVDAKGQCVISLREIEGMTGLSHSGVCLKLKALSKIGLIQRSPGNATEPTRYTLWEAPI